MHNNQSSYSRWSWIIALILALILLWMLLTGRGPSSACCGAPNVAATPIEDVVHADAVTEAFSFSATAEDFTSSGDDTNIGWVTNADALKALLLGGLQAEGDDQSVVLTGTVDSGDTKQQKGLDAQVFFGEEVAIDNQLSIAMAMVAEPITAMEPPPAAKLYFDTGVSHLPFDGERLLAPIIAWLNDHSDATAVISGYHDPTGKQARNASLSKQRAESTFAAIVAAGIDATRLEMVKPISTDGGEDLAEARRVEVLIQ